MIKIHSFLFLLYLVENTFVDGVFMSKYRTTAGSVGFPPITNLKQLPHGCHHLTFGANIKKNNKSDTNS
jgi:hypothetical protein